MRRPNPRPRVSRAAAYCRRLPGLCLISSRQRESAKAPGLVPRLAALFCGLLILSGVGLAKAQLAPTRASLARSVSGQFIIQSASRSLGSPLVSVLENDTNFVRLDPTLLAVSCERIKQLINRELGATAAWNGKVFLRLYPVNSADDPVTLDLEQFRDGWQYRLNLPDVIRRERYVGALVEVILLEMANRNAQTHAAELPPWLAEGLTRQLLFSAQQEIILPPPQMSEAGLRMSTLLVNARQANPLALAHEELSNGRPLNFQQLSWPATDQSSAEGRELYCSSAQLFVHQLLALPKGPECMRSMLEELPSYYNWQFAFLHAFRESFTRPLDVEKWWSLQLVHFTGRELGEAWSADESWQKLDELVRSAVQIRVGTNELPLHGEISLQSIVRDWEPVRQTQALEYKLAELQMLRPRLARDLALLVDEYCRTLESYVQNLSHKGFVLPFRKHELLRRNREVTIQHLDELDAQRQALRPPATQNSNAPAQLNALR